MPPPRDEALLALFHAHDRSPLRVVLRSGSILTVFNIAWGYDSGDEYSHVTTNMSPDVEGSEVDFFFTDDVDRVLERGMGTLLFCWP